MIRVTNIISIDESELEFTFVRSPGPGGQNVNKVATCCHLRFDVAGSTSLPAAVQRRLGVLAGRRMNAAGELILVARRYRSQARNRDDAVERLVALLRAAAAPPKKRRPTRPTVASRRRRLESKRHRSLTKRLRRLPEDE